MDFCFKSGPKNVFNQISRMAFEKIEKLHEKHCTEIQKWVMKTEKVLKIDRNWLKMNKTGKQNPIFDYN